MAKGYPDYIVVEGPIGVGKTTLARRLAETFATDLLLEGAENNPFLPRFYEDPASTALPTQLYFLFQRARRIQSLRQTDMFKPVQVADFLMEKDRLFAKLTLSDDELPLYNQVYEKLTLDAPVPDLVIYLQAPVEVLQKRIAARAIPYERNIQEEYLQRVADAYVAFFYNFNVAPLLIVNTAEIDLAHDNHHYDLLLRYIRNLPPGRRYFNPAEL
ncbi:MAG: deoxynucleoside kinase [Gammaproteobacteria bacterium]|nr:deoxynucleoside kinase [Gammaproteobacteria bacterium]MCI0591308.1 deoxynucleoside kinase [Gammaproteobacteria bacterium]